MKERTKFSGACTAASYTATSDERKKAFITDIPEEQATDMCNRIRCCGYQMRSEPGMQRYGTVAQSLLEHEDLAPFVSTADDGCYSVNYLDMIALLCKSLQHAHARLDALGEGRVQEDKLMSAE